MPLDKKNLKVLVECLVGFESIKRNGFDVIPYLVTQGFDDYFRMLNGPLYRELVKELWVRAEVYDEDAAKMEKWEKIVENPSQKGKTRKQMSLEEFKKTEIRSVVMGIRVTITEEVISMVAKCSNSRKFQSKVKKNSPWVK